jgi:signal transduction histidine kinase
MRKARPIGMPLLAWLLLACLCRPVLAAPEIVAVEADARDLAIQAPRGTAPATVTVPARAQGVVFRFRNSAAEPADRPERGAASAGVRLKYRLDGVDQAWRDVPAAVRAMIHFVDASESILAGTTADITGESAGWTGDLTTAAYQPYRLTAVAPATASRVTAAFVTYNNNPLVGSLGIDQIVLAIDRDGRRLHEIPLDPGDIPAPDVTPFSTPALWRRLGSRAEIARVMVRPAPAPHAVLALVDDDVGHFGNWASDPAASPAVEPGDVITLSWTAAHSLGQGGEQFAGYGRLSPGTYSFRVASFHPCGAATGVETSLAIIIPRPWYARWEVWGVGLAAAAAAAVIAGRSWSAARLRQRLAAVERAHAFEQERARIARDLHDELGAALSEIAMQAAGVADDVRQAGLSRVATAADGIGAAAGDLIRGVDAIVWAVNPANDTLERFASYLVQSSQQYLDAAGLAVRFRVPTALPPLGIAGAVRHRVFLAVREALHNAAQHAAARTVVLAIGLDRDAVEVVVEDDGRGFDVASPPPAGHDGLANIRQRMAEIGGDCLITSSPAGTRVALRIPTVMLAAAVERHDA